MKTVITTPQFASLTEEEVNAALDIYESSDDMDEENSAATEPADPIVAEVARLIAAYADKFDEYCEASAELPDTVLNYEPQVAIEQVAFGIFMDAVFDAFQDADEDE